MPKVPLTTIGLSLAALGSTILGSPAQAAIDCGTSPFGGSMTHTADYCQVVFETPGDYAATVPASAKQLFAIVIGGGGDYYNPQEHYAGNAGKVTYGNLTASISNDLSIHVGEGGDGNDQVATPGNDSSVSDPSLSKYVTAYGGSIAGLSFSICTVPGFDGNITSAGPGARTDSNLNQSTHSCVGAEGSGVNPSLGDRDSDGHAVPAIFSNLNQTFGKGGFVAILNDGVNRNYNYGDGAGFTVDPVEDSIQNPGDGSNGAVILRWAFVAANGSLAATGSDAQGMSALAGGLITLGLGITVASRVRRRAAK